MNTRHVLPFTIFFLTLTLFPSMISALCTVDISGMSASTSFCAVDSEATPAGLKDCFYSGSKIIITASNLNAGNTYTLTNNGNNVCTQLVVGTGKLTCTLVTNTYTASTDFYTNTLFSLADNDQCAGSPATYSFSIKYASRPVLTSVTASSSVTYSGNSYCDANGNGLQNCPRRPGSPYYSEPVTLTFAGSNFVSGTGTRIQLGNAGTEAVPCTSTTLTYSSPSTATCTLSSLALDAAFTSATVYILTKGGLSISSVSITRAPVPTITALSHSSCTTGGTCDTVGSVYACTALTSCPTAGGGTLTVRGTNFLFGSTGLPLPSITATDVNNIYDKYCTSQPIPLAGSETTAFTCTLKGGLDSVTVTPTAFAAGGLSTVHTATFQFVGTPTVSSVTTLYCDKSDSAHWVDCPVNGGTFSTSVLVEFTGTNFVEISGGSYSSTICVDGSFVRVSSIKVTCELLGKVSSSTVTVSLSILGQSVTIPTLVDITYINSPTISGFVAGTSGCTGGATLTNCPVAGGGVLTIQGTNFGYLDTTPTSVSFHDDQFCTGLTWKSMTEIECTLSAQGSNTATVNPIIAIGSQTSGAATMSWVAVTIDALNHDDCTGATSITDCPTSGGGTLTITGTGFGSSGTIVVPADSVCESVGITRLSGSEATKITCTLKANSAAGSSSSQTITLTVNGVAVTSSVTVAYLGIPTITSIRHDNCYDDVNNDGDVDSGENAGAASLYLIDCPVGGTGFLTITGTNFGKQISKITMANDDDDICSDAFQWDTMYTAIKCTLKARASASLYATSPVITVDTVVSTTVASVKYPSADVPTISSMSVSGATLTNDKCKQDGDNGLMQCKTAGGDTVVITGTNFVGTVTSNICDGGTCVTAGSTSCSCTLVAGSHASVVAATVTADGGTSASVDVEYVSNTYTSSPTVVVNSLTQLTITFTASQGSGKAYVVATSSLESDDSFENSFMKTQDIGNQILCRSDKSSATPITTTGSEQTYVLTCNANLGSTVQLATLKVAVYIETQDKPGTLNIVTVPVCHSTCGTCSASLDPSKCDSCTGSLHISGSIQYGQYATSGFCCHANCATCGDYSSGTPPASAERADQCTGCTALVQAPLRSANVFVNPVFWFNGAQSTSYQFLKPGYSGSYSASAKGFCCHYSCLTCVDSTAGKCTSCPGRNADVALASTSTASFTDSALQFQSSPPTYGTCQDLAAGPSNNYAEIRGDPHFHGFQDQSYTITGAPDTVYNIISCPNIQMNTRFISYGDIYDGEDPTFNPPKPYSCNVTYIGEIGIKFRDVKTNKEYKFYTNIANMEVKVNDELVPMGKEHQIYSEASVSHAKDSIEIITPFFKWKFLRTGPKNKRFFNEQVAVRDWDSLPSCHGLLGQTHQREQMAIDRNAFDFEHVPGQDFLFKNAEFLDGRLIEYEIAENDVFGHKNAFDRYTPQ